MMRKTTLMVLIVAAARLTATVSPSTDIAATNAPLPALTIGAEGERIAIIGDSITQHGARSYGYITRMKMAMREAYPSREIKIIPSGIGNDTAQKVRGRLKADVLGEKPTMVIVEVGLADIYTSERRPIDRKM